ncbi:hemerythrin family protein [Sulfurospirillum sp. T05]|uniref:Hemerythrin family protein n=1 Tax=Sulfurospirillum tamanense TaxID=2813362 RepID=A0ABS2WTE9_9BACT|nr:hemerythrin family protein [Sulfurospirillum tamanensis]MBN2964911.1 hemerythrin family protein [Sulfurospirillum tamanensis]
MLPTWKPQYSVNHSLLDAQHQELFRLALEVYTLSPQRATKEKVRTLLKNFYMYMKEHFKEEEAYMEEIGYENREEHGALHADIIEAMNGILQQSHSFLEIQAALRKIVRVWLMEHILVHDMQYEKWRKAKRREEAQAKPIAPDEITDL